MPAYILAEIEHHIADHPLPALMPALVEVAFSKGGHPWPVLP
jgi:hypothetical protein